MRISCARDVVHDRAPGIVGVHVTVAERQILPYNVSIASSILLRFASTLIAPSIMNGGEHVRSGSPNPLPVPPRHHNDGYRGDRPRRSEPERHRSHRRRDHDRGHGRVHQGGVRVQDLYVNPIHHHSPSVCFFIHSKPSCRQAQEICPLNISRMLSIGTEIRSNTPISSAQDVPDAKRPCV